MGIHPASASILTDMQTYDMVICMKTTLNIDDTLMRQVKQHAAKAGSTITALIESALRELLAQEKQPKKPYRFDWKPVPGKLRPGVDLTDRDQLYEIMGGR